MPCVFAGTENDEPIVIYYESHGSNEQFLAGWLIGLSNRYTRGSPPDDRLRRTTRPVNEASPISNRFSSSTMLNNWELVWKCSSPESGFGESMSVATVYGKALR